MDIEIEDLDKFKRIYLIGIGGVSMSSIAETLKIWGYDVAGSDLNKSAMTEKLVSDGINVTIGHNLEELEKCDLVIYNAAIPDEDEELSTARKLNIPTVSRGKFVGFLTKKYRQTICVSGTHGKTTTTSMISSCFLNANLDPSIEVGAYFNEIDGNYRIGKSDYFILESCEYKANFLNFFPNTAVVLNIDNDHLDYYKNFDNIVDAFKKFASLVPSDGLLVINGDDENCLKLETETKAKVITYGIKNEKANFVAKNIKFDDEGYGSFDVYNNDKYFESFHLSVSGKHNVLNSLAAIAVSDYYGISREIIKQSLENFIGAARRLELKGTFGDNIRVYDDYAHHPTEINAILESIKNKKYNESWVIFQPHTYSRTKALLKDFASVLSKFDNVIVTDIYAAREKDTGEISSSDLKNEIEVLGKKVNFIKNFDDIVDFVKSNAKKDDIVITVGAGDITKLADMFVK